MLRNCIVTLLLIVSAGLYAQSTQLYSYGQQDPQFTQYMFNPSSFNPAVAGEMDGFQHSMCVISG